MDIRLEATELPKIEPYAVVELENAVYDPYVQRGNFPVLVERVTCKGHPFCLRQRQRVKAGSQSFPADCSVQREGAREQGRVRGRGVSHGKLRKAGMMNGDNKK